MFAPEKNEPPEQASARKRYRLAEEISLEENPLLIGSELAGWYRSLAQEDRLESGP